MDPWCRSDITFQYMEGLTRHVLLYAQTAAKEWLLPGEEEVSFVHFHERGFATPTHGFLWGAAALLQD